MNIVSFSAILSCFDSHSYVSIFLSFTKTILQSKKQQRHLCSNRISHSPSLSLEFLLLINPLTSGFRTHIVTLSDTACECAGVSILPYLGISIPRKTPNFSRFYKKLGPFYKKLRCDKFGN